LKSVGPFKGEHLFSVALALVVGLLLDFLGPLVESRGFGFSAWFHGAIDYFILPVFLPLGIWALVRKERGRRLSIDAVDFTLLWLVPVSIIGCVRWSVQVEGLNLVLIPLLWSALAVSLPFFFTLARENLGLMAFFGVLGVVLLPLVAITAYWAFFGQRILIGLLSTLFTIAPMVVQFAMDYRKVQLRWSLGQGLERTDEQSPTGF
jgi:hypothetical protein